MARNSSLSELPAALRARATRASYKAEALIFRVGSASHAVYFIEAGAVRLMRRGRDGEEIVLHQARAGEFFAEASIDSARYHCDAIAVEKTEVLKVSAANLTDLIRADPDFARQWVSLLARQLRTVRSRVERLSLKSDASCDEVRIYDLNHTPGEA